MNIRKAAVMAVLSVAVLMFGASARGADEKENAPNMQGPKQTKEIDLGKFSISGYRTIKFRDYSASGDKDQFRSNNGMLFYTQKIEQSSFITLHGDLPRNLTVDGTFSEVPYQDRTLRLDIVGKNGTGKLGDFSTSFPGDKLVGFTKNIRGVEYIYDFGSLKFNAVVSKQKSKTNRITLKGQNRRGPYNMGTFSIVEGTEQVKIDGVTKRARDDYYIDYFRGDITFRENIDPAQTIEITYESDLLLGIKTGSMSAYGLEYSPEDGRYTVGASMMNEGTNSLAQSVLISNNMDIFVPAADVGKAKSLRTSLMRQDYALLEKNAELITISGSALARDVDYSIDYLNGAITFMGNKFIGGATATVSYTYFNPKYVSAVDAEEIREYGAAHIFLAKSTIYSGTELVQYCRLESGSGRFTDDCEILTACSSAPAPGALCDYLITEADNSITLTRKFPNREYGVRIDYKFVQKNGPAEQAVERNIYDAYVKAKINDRLNVEGEVSQTKSDLSGKTVQILEEYVATVSDPNRRTYCLKFRPEPGTVEIYFDDLDSVNSRKYYISDYTIESNSGNYLDTTAQCAGKDRVVAFKTSTPVGTTIIANYTYKPTLPGNSIRTGAAYRAAVNYNSDRVQLKGEYTDKDTEFAPINEFNSMEQNRLETSATVGVTDNIKMFADYLGYDLSHGFDTPDRDRYVKSTAGMTWNSRRFKEVTLKSSRYKAKDNLATRRMDNNRDTDELILKYDLTGHGKFVTDTRVSNSRFRDRTATISDKDSHKTHFGLEYKPGEKLNLKTYYEANKIDVKAPAGFGTNTTQKGKTVTRAMDIGYYPNDIWGITGNLLLQTKEDGRVGKRNERWDSARVGVAASEFGHIKFIQASFYRQDLPNQYIGSTKTDTISSTFGYRLATLWQIEPSFDKIKSLVSDYSGSKSDTLGMYLSFNPDATLKYDAGLRYRRTKRINSTATSSTSQDEDQYVISAAYRPSKRTSYNTRFDTQKINDGGKTDIYSAGVRYKPTAKLETSLDMIRTRRSASYASNNKNELIFDARYKLNDTFTAGANLKRQKYTSTPTSLRDYSGTLLEMDLTATF